MHTAKRKKGSRLVHTEQLLDAGQTFRARICGPLKGDVVWQARLAASPAFVVCELVGWVTLFPRGLGHRLGFRNHLRLIRARIAPQSLVRGHGRWLLHRVSEVLSLPVEPTSMWDVVERYPSWDWLEQNRGALSPEELLTDGPSRRPARGG